MNTLQLQFLISILAEWVNRGQQDIIEYLQEENPVLREQLGAERLLFTEVRRRHLAAKAKKIGRKGLFEMSTLVTPDTFASMVPEADQPIPETGKFNRLDADAY